MPSSDETLAPPTIGRSRFLAGHPLPPVLTRDEVAAILGVSHATGWRLEKSNKLAPFELLPRIGRPHYSGKKVQAWLDGDGEQLRYFQSARRQLRG